ncbi:hypothetical protein [Bradyrhizobium sp. USDA 3240]
MDELGDWVRLPHARGSGKLDGITQLALRFTDVPICGIEPTHRDVMIVERILRGRFLNLVMIKRID